MLQHHPNLHLLTEYAAGSLSIAHAVCVAVHLESCGQCQEQLHHHSELGAALLALEKPSQVSQGLLDNVLMKLDQMQSIDHLDSAPGKECLSNESSQLPTLVQKIMALEYDQLEWRALGAKLKFHRLRTGDPRVELGLYRIAAGGTIPHHTHQGEEITVVLKGSFSDQLGFYQPGDITYRSGNDKHTPTATLDKECLCLSSLSAPVKFTGLLHRVLNPFLKVCPQ